MNLVSRVFESAEKHKDLPALRWKEETWQEIFYRDFSSLVIDLARGLRAKGIHPGDRVAIYSMSCPDWVLCDIAILACGAISVPIYNTSTPDVVAYILNHAEAKAILSAPGIHAEVAAKLQETRFSQLQAFSFDDLEKLRELGKTIPIASIENEISKLQEIDLATIIYTSGTTADPKGVMLSHGNILSNCDATKSFFPLRPGERSLSFLPLSHGFERMAGMFLMLLNGISISYVKDPTQMAGDLQEIQPNIMMVVPRVLEKFFLRVQEGVHQRPKLMQRFFWSSVRHAKNLDEKQMGQMDWKRRVADWFFFRKVRNGLGGKLELIVSGGAPLAPEIARFFCAVGMEVLEGYGLTETSPVVCVNRPGNIRFGTVGPPMPDIEVQIGPQGEILVRGPNIMKGYYKDPENTSRVIDSQGWFHTGDIGQLDEAGHLQVTDRIKELIVTSGGKNIAPQPLENELILDPLIEQVCIIGDRRNYLTALLVPNFELLERMARKENLGFSTHASLVGHPRVLEWIQEVMDRFNANKSSFQTIKNFTLLSRPWSIEEGEITPTLKLKRRVINQVHAHEIDRMYRKP